MSFFMLSMPLSGLMSSPPVSKQTPLPTSVTLGWPGSPQVRSIRRGGRAAARPTAWISGKLLLEQIVADDGVHLAPWRGRERARGVFELGRAHVVGRRVDEVAGKADALRDAGQVVAIDVARQLEPDVLGVLLAVAREAVGAEREGERRELANRAGRWRSGRLPAGSELGQRPRPEQVRDADRPAASSANRTPPRAPSARGRSR